MTVIIWTFVVCAFVIAWAYILSEYGDHGSSGREQ